MRKLGLSVIVSALVVALVGCGDSPSTEPAGSEQSYDGTWKLVEGHGPDGEVPIVDGYRITLTIERSTIGGTAACNQYGGDASIDGGSFAMHGGSMTEMGCRSDVMESQDSYMAALQAANAIARQGDTLTLTGDKTRLRFGIVPPIPTADLIDTRWKLESLIYGTGDEGTVTSAAPATLVLEKDGTLTGSTGCRKLYGEWTEDGDEIAFTSFGAKGNCSEDLREQDGHVVTVLGDGFAPDIEGDRLTLIDRGGLGLEYRAAR